MYRIFCMPDNSALSKDEKAVGMRVTSPESGDLSQSSTYLMFSASRFQAAHSAVTQRSLEMATRDFKLSSTEGSPDDTGLMPAISEAPEPTSVSILDR